MSDANVILRLGPFKLAIEHLRFYARKIAEFAEQIPGACNLIFDDKQELIRSSIQPVMLVTLQRNRANCNYFGCEPRHFDKNKLDEKEYALIVAAIVVRPLSGIFGVDVDMCGRISRSGLVVGSVVEIGQLAVVDDVVVVVELLILVELGLARFVVV